MIKRNYFILVGAMGGGKSTILARLAEAGVYCVPEPARAILAEQRMTKSAGVPALNAEAFNQLMLARAIHHCQSPTTPEIGCGASSVANASANDICCPATNASAKVAVVSAACTVARAASARARMGPLIT